MVETLKDTEDLKEVIEQKLEENDWISIYSLVKQIKGYYDHNLYSRVKHQIQNMMSEGRLDSKKVEGQKTKKNVYRLKNE